MYAFPFLLRDHVILETDGTLGGHLVQPVIYRKKTLKNSFIHKYVLSVYYMLDVVLHCKNKQQNMADK